MISEELIQEQIRLEEEMTRRGAERYLRDVFKARSAGREDGTAYGQSILSGRLEVLSKAIATWMSEAEGGRTGPLQTAYTKVKDMEPETLAYLTLKHVLSGVSSTRTLQFVSVTIGTAVEDEARYLPIREKERKAYNQIVERAAKRTAYHYRHYYALRRAEHLNDGWERWTKIERLHVGTKLLSILMDTIGIVEIVHQRVDKEQSAKYVRASQETLEWIEKKNEAAQFLRPVYEPMVVPPRDWTSPLDGGYLSSNIKPLKLVKTKKIGRAHV